MKRAERIADLILHLAPTLFLLVALSVIVTSAHAAWQQFPSSSEVESFAANVDSVVVSSVGLPDSAEAAGRRGVDVLDVAHLRQRTVMSQRWGRELAENLLARRHLDARCNCHFVKERSDTSEVVAAVLTFHVGKEVMWTAITFRDTCARVFLQQGTWGTARLDENRSTLLGLFREALPAEAAFSRDSFPPVARKPTVPPRLDELPEVIEKVKPQYPAEAITRGMSGTVRVMTLVGTNGTIKDARVIWSVPHLDEAALRAVWLWRFKPARLDGKPVEAWVVTPVRFTLQ